jgi:hypothetical protein
MFSGQENRGVVAALFKWTPTCRGIVMTRKHLKGSKPSDADLYRNPMIGGSKGTAMAQVTATETRRSIRAIEVRTASGFKPNSWPIMRTTKGAAR